ILRVTDSVISGSAALYVLDTDRASDWYPKDLDIYAPNHSYKQIINYLIALEDYEKLETPPPRKYPYAASGISSVTHLHRDGIQIDIIQSATRSALHPIPCFWATHVMNYLSADNFCIAYPEYTLSGKALLNPIHLVECFYPPPATLTNLSKYMERGYDFRMRP
ncbi:hypothetical protein FKP32DRAFT_1534223, partial [Trametes sanguinea]